MLTIGLFFVMYITGIILFKDQGFAKTQNFLNLFISNAGLIVIATGMTIVMITGGIDISVGSVVAMICMLLAWMMQNKGIGAVPAVLIALGVGMVFGGVFKNPALYCNPGRNVLCQRYDCYYQP